MNQSSADNRTVVLERTFDAPVALVWEAWTQPDHIAKWWGPQGMKTTIEEHDFKVGGVWKYSMVMPNGSKFITEGIYSEIEAYKLIITTADFRPMTEGVELQAHFKAIGEKTQFIFKVVHATEAYRKQQEEMGIYNGWGSTFDRLESYLTR